MNACALVPLLAALALSARTATAQLTHVIPNGFASTPGNTATTLPWHFASTLTAGARSLSVYAASNFTNAGITQPILIQRLRWRTRPNAGSWTGGTFARVTVQLATAALPYNAMSTVPAANLGPDLTVVATGPVAFPAGTGGAGTGPWVVDVMLATPFVYDPQLGGLAIDVDIANAGGLSFNGTSTPTLDVDTSATTQSGRLLASTTYPATTSIAAPFGLIVEVTYVASSGGVATRSEYGQGCYSRARSYYQLFTPAASFDLGGTATTTTSIQHQFTGTGYAVSSGPGNWRTPAGINLGMGDDTQTTRAIPFTFPFPGGSTTQLVICSNGFISPVASNGTGYIADIDALLTGNPRYCPYWHDLVPSTGTPVLLELDAPGGAAYVTWNGVPTYSGGANTFQAAFFSTGTVEYRYRLMSGQSLPNPSVIVGWSPGGGVRNPGSRSISTTLPFATDAADLAPLQLAAAARPVLGTTVNLLTSGIPAGTPFGAMILGFTRHDPGLPLSGIGMPGCSQFTSLDSSSVFITSGAVQSQPQGIPGSPLLAGMLVRCQSATFSMGLNALGVIASNGVELRLNPQ